MKNFTVSPKSPLIRTLRAGVILGVMAMLLQANYCMEQMPGDDVADSTIAQADGSSDRDIGADCTSHDQCKSKNCYKKECAAVDFDSREIGEVCAENIQCANENCSDGECAPGKVGAPCTKHGHCASKNCEVDTCEAADDDERGLDEPCSDGIQCASKECQDDKCTAPTSCINSEKDGDETDVDCGGAICPKCVVGQECSVDTDCASAKCGDDNLCKKDTQAVQIMMLIGNFLLNN